MSGITPYGSIADQVPVRPAPDRTSSAMNSTLYLSQISRTRRKYPRAGTDAPVETPPTGSAMKAATFSAPARRIASSRTEPLHIGHAGTPAFASVLSPPHSHL